MNLDPQYFTTVQAFRDRIGQYLAAARQEGMPAALAMEELQTALEELSSAEEELRQQNEELIESRELLEEERRRYRDLFDMAPDAYFVTDTRGVIREANVAAARLLNVRREFLPGRSLLNFLADPDVRQARREMGQLSHTFRACEWTARIMPRAAESLYVSAAITAMAAPGDVGERLVGIRWLLRDVTAQFHAQEQVRELNAALEERIAERTAALEAANRDKQAALAREHAARLEAEAANQAKDRFLAVLSHELRNPLTPVLTACELLGRSPELPDETRAELEMMRRNVLVAARLVDDLLDISRVIHGKLELHRQPTDLHAVLAAVRDITRQAAADKGLELVFELAATRRCLDADPARLQQVFWNLVNNAIKFTPHGRVTVRTSDVPAAEPRGAGRAGTVRIEVIDTGVGIDAGALERMFNPFDQSGAAGGPSGGLGLGLAIARSLVHAHDGTIHVFSEGPGTGARFAVEFPGQPIGCGDEAEGLTRGMTRGMAKAPQPGEGKSARALAVLVVDDHADTLRAVSRALRSMGHQVQTAATLHEALDTLQAGRFDLVISDLSLPDGSGHDLLRRSPAGRVGRAVALTGHGDVEQIARSREAGFAAHLTKPVSIEQLIAELDAAAQVLA